MAMFDFSLDDSWAVAQGNLDFDLSEVRLAGESDGIEDSRYMPPRVYESLKGKVAYENAREFVNDWIGELRPGFRLFAVVSGDFVFGDVLTALATRGLMIAHMTIQTLSMSEHNIDALRQVMEHLPDMRLRIALSDYFYAHERRPGHLVPYLYESLDVDDRLDVAFASTHMKIVTIRTANGGKIVIDGSANLRSSRNIEQFRLECDPDLYDWVEGMNDRIFEAYGTINKDRPYPKSLRYSGLWGAVEGRKGAKP